VITVGSIGKSANKAYYSNFGATVEIAAQGGDKTDPFSDTILSTLNSGTTSPLGSGWIYTKYQGTSMAAPHVAGVASLMLSINGSLTPAQVTSLMQANSTPFPGGVSCTTANCGAGILNAGAAVVAARDFVAPVTPPGAFNKSSPSSSTTRRNRPVTLVWGSSSGATSYEYCIDTINNSACDTGWVSVGNSTSVVLNSLAANTTYRWQVRSLNGGGTTYANGSATSYWQLRTR
jgi:subtilisin family serine protease